MSLADLRLTGDALLLAVCCARIAEGVALGSPMRVYGYAFAALLTVLTPLVIRR